MKRVQWAIAIVEIGVAALLVVVGIQHALAPHGYCDDGPTGGTCITTSIWQDPAAVALVAGIAITVLALVAHAVSTMLRLSRRPSAPAGD